MQSDSRPKRSGMHMHMHSRLETEALTHTVSTDRRKGYTDNGKELAILLPVARRL